MRASARLPAVLLACTALLLNHSAAMAQSRCFIEDGVRACPVGPDPGEGIERDDPTPVDTPPDPRQVALQNAVSRYQTLIHSLSDSSSILDGSWLNSPVGTETEFFETANQLHNLLFNQADAIRFRVATLQERLERLNGIADTYPRLIAANRAEIATLRLEHDGLAVALKNAQQQLELTTRTSGQLEARASHFQEDAKKNKDAILGWISVLLPPDMAKAASPQAYGTALDWVPSVPERQPDPPTVEASIPQQPAQLNVSRLGVVNIGTTPAPLTGTAENAVAQLEADASELRTALAGNSSDLANNVDTLEPVVVALQQESKDVETEKDGITSEVKASTAQLKQAGGALNAAQDGLKAAQETFLYRASEAWIWENAKTEAVQQLKDETRRLVAAKWIGVAYRDLTDEDSQTLVSAGKRNILGLGDKVLSSGDELYEVVTRINTLQTHGQDYMQQAVRIASLGSPQRMIEFVGGMSDGLDDDSEELAKSNLGAMNIPEPWKSIAAKHFIKETAE